MAIKTLIIAFLTGASILAGCSKAPDADAAEIEPDPVKRRMNDPAYVKKLEDLNAERKEIAKGASAAIAAWKDAKAANASEEELKKLQAEMDKWEEKLSRHTIKARATVAAQMKATEVK